MAPSSGSWLTLMAREGPYGGRGPAVVVHVGDDDVARADVARDRHGHDADRTGAGDQHVLADEAERQRGVRGVAERSRIEATSSLIDSGSLKALNAGITRYSAKQPGRLTPTPTVLRHSGGARRGSCGSSRR